MIDGILETTFEPNPIKESFELSGPKSKPLGKWFVLVGYSLTGRVLQNIRV
jgi:hypothetical protein